MATSNDKSFEIVFNKYELGLKKAEKLEKENENLGKENEKLRKENDTLRTMAKGDEVEIVHDTELIKKNETLLAENAELKEKLAQPKEESNVEINLIKYFKANASDAEFIEFKNKMLLNAIQIGDFKCVKFLYENYGYSKCDKFLTEAFKYKNADITKYLMQKQIKNITDAHLCAAIKNGNLDIVKYLIEHGIFITHESLNYDKYECLRVAAEKGYLEVIKYVKKMYNFDINVNDGKILRFASAEGHFDLVKWLIEECQADIHVDNEHPLLNAINHKHFDIVKYLIAHGATVNATLLDKAKINSSKEIIEYLRAGERPPADAAPPRNIH